MDWRTTTLGSTGLLRRQQDRYNARAVDGPAILVWLCLSSGGVSQSQSVSGPVSAVASPSQQQLHALSLSTSSSAQPAPAWPGLLQQISGSSIAADQDRIVRN